MATIPAPRTSAEPILRVTYSTRARSTGATVSAGKTEHGWGTHCINHDKKASAPNREEAERMVSHPQDWCAKCKRIAAGKAPKITRQSELADLL